MGVAAYIMHVSLLFALSNGYLDPVLSATLERRPSGNLYLSIATLKLRAV